MWGAELSTLEVQIASLWSRNNASCRAAGDVALLVAKATTSVDLFFKRWEDKHIQSVFKQHVDGVKGLLQLAGLQGALAALGVHLQAEEAEALMVQMDIVGRGGLDVEGFERAARSPSKAEQWAGTLPLAGLLASALCFAGESEGGDPLRQASRFSAARITAATRAFGVGVGRTLGECQVQLRRSFEEMDRRAKEGSSGASSKFATSKMSCGLVDDFHSGLTGRIGEVAHWSRELDSRCVGRVHIEQISRA